MPYSENGGPVAITSALTLDDLDDTRLESAVIVIDGNYTAGEDQLNFTDTATIISSWNASTGTLTLTGSDTVAAYQAALRAITYENLSDNPNVLTRTVSFTVSDGDFNSNSVSRNIGITAINDSPVQSSIETTDLPYTENDGPLAITSTLTLSDVDDLLLDSASVSITGNFFGTQDILSFSNTATLSGAFNSATGVLTISGIDTVAAYQAALRSITYSNSSDNPVALSRTVTFAVSDGELDSAPIRRNVDVLPVNDQPVSSAIEAVTLDHIENDSPVVISTTLALTDPDDTLLESAEVAITSNYIAGEDVLAFSDTGSISSSFNATTGVLSLFGTDTIAAYETALRSVSYHNTSDNPDISPRTVVFIVNDGDADSSASSRLVSITAVNDAPVQNSVEAAPLIYDENDGAVAITSTLQLNDVDDLALERAVITIADNFIATEDILAFTNTATIISSWDALTGTLVLTGSESISGWQAALRSVTYENLSDNLTPLTRNIEFRVNDGAADSNTISRAIVVNAINDAPVQTGLETLPLAYTENAGGKTVTTSIVLSDIDNTRLQSATLRISGNYTPTEDQLAFVNTALITGSWDSATGTLTLTGSATLAEYQTALRSVVYSNSNDDPSTLDRTVSFTVNDGTADASHLTRLIELTAVNDAPGQTGIESTPLVYRENDGAVATTSTVILNDLDNSSLASLRVSFTSNYSPAEDRLAFTDTATLSGSWDILNGELLISGIDSVAAYQDALRSVTYENLSDEPNTAQRRLSYSASDGLLNTNTLTRDIVILDVNDEPSGTDKIIAINEDEPYAITIPDLGFNDIADDDQLMSVLISTLPSAGTLTLDGNPIAAGSSISQTELNAGSLVFTPVPDEHGTAYDSFSFQVRDDAGTVNGGIDLDLTANTLSFDVAPVSDSPLGSDARISLLEDTDYILARADFGFSDPADSDRFTSVIIDQLPAAGTLLLNGEAVLPAQIISVTDIDSGFLVFSPALNEFGDNYGVFPFRVQDSGTDGGSTTADAASSISIDVISVNDEPSGENATVQTPEDIPHTFTVANFGFSDPGDNGVNSFQALTIVSLPEIGTLTVDGVEAVPGQLVTTIEIDAGLLIYTPPLNETGIGYNGFSFRVHDDGGTANGGVDIDSTVNLISFDLPGVNDAPLLLSEGGIVDEGAELVIDSSMLFGADADDPDPQELTISITTLPAHGILLLDGKELVAGDQLTLDRIVAGALSYQHDESETSEDRFGVRLADGGEDNAQPVIGDFELTINEVIDPAPILENDTLELSFGQGFRSIDGDLLGSGYSGLSGNSLSNNTVFQVEIVTPPEHGELVLHADGTFSYTHDGSIVLVDEFSYRVTNEDGISTVATVTISIEPPIESAFAPAAPPAERAITGPDTDTESEVKKEGCSVESVGILYCKYIQRF